MGDDEDVDSLWSDWDIPRRMMQVALWIKEKNEVKVLTTLGMFAVPCTAETTIGEIRQKVQEWKPEYSLEQIELICKDKDAWGPLFNKTSRPRDDDEDV